MNKGASVGNGAAAHGSSVLSPWKNGWPCPNASRWDFAEPPIPA